MKNRNTILGEFLRTARESKSLTLRAVEKEIGVSNAYLSQIEGGRIQQPSPVILNKLSRLYEISYTDVMGAAGYPTLNSSSEPSTTSKANSRIGPVTSDEEEALIEYLAFLRSKRNRGKQR